jgi:hypothetical protein
MNREILGDLGDPLFVCWVLLWTGGQMLRALTGDVGALADYWNGNIFYPAVHTVAFSEHLTPLTIQILPVLAATQNVVLGYNLLVFSTIVLSGLGMYLLVREITGRPLAAFVAGLAFAFAPYRVDQAPHLQVLSSQWMPFAFLGFRRFFATGRLRALMGGAVALAAQALSCVYYLAYFPPFIAAYCLYEMVSRRRLFAWRTWLALTGAAAGTLLVLAPFLLAYVHVRQTSTMGVRAIAEITNFSADTHAFATISGDSRLLGHVVRAMPKNEGQGFPGFTIAALGLVAMMAALGRNVGNARAAAAVSVWRQIATGALCVIAVTFLFVLGQVLVNGRCVLVWGDVFASFHGAARLVVETGLVVAALAFVSPPIRRVLRGSPGSPVAFFALAAGAAAWMAMGPTMHADGRAIGPGLYAVFYRWVPGFDGLRVPSLNFMHVALFLAVLVGLGASSLLARFPRAGKGVLVAAMVGILAESWAVPVNVNLPLDSPGLAQAPTTIATGAELDPLYAMVRALPKGAVLIEFPFGDPAYEIQYTFYAGYHRKPIVNGYSGFYPPAYRELQGLLGGVPTGPTAWGALMGSGATHAIVHERAFLGSAGSVVSTWLRDGGARELAQVGRDRLFQLR